MAEDRRIDRDSRTQKQLYDSSIQARGFLRSAISLYNSVRENKFKEVPLEGHFIVQDFDGTRYSWGDMNSIHVNIGFSLELILKRIQYYDREEILKSRSSPKSSVKR